MKKIIEIYLDEKGKVTVKKLEESEKADEVMSFLFETIRNSKKVTITEVEE